MSRYPEIIAVFTLLIVIQANPGLGWEFSLKGQFNWEYDVYSQLGSRGFFGPFDIDESNNPLGYGGAIGSAASMNGWLGHDIGQISSGSDLAQAIIYMDVTPEFRLNQAVRIRGTYRIGSWATPSAPTSAGALVRSEYAEGMAPGILRSFSPGYWNTLWLTAQTPWGILVVGKRPAPFGMGLFLDAEDNADVPGVLLLTPFGPFRFGFIFTPWVLGSVDYFTLADKNAVHRAGIAGLLTYESGPLSFGVATRYFTFRTGPESATFQGTDDPVAPTGRFGVVPSETAVNWGIVFAKYNNGVFFANVEVDGLHGLTRNQKWLSSASGMLEGGRSRFAPTYVEHWRFATEIGLLAGPSKISLLYAWISGPDRRHGIRIDRQGDLRFVSTYSNVTLFRSYSLLLSYDYGMGNNSITVDSAHGYVTDANVLGARLDYAVASNLNVFGTFFNANRLSHGYGWGFIRPQYDEPAGRFTGRVQYLEGDQFSNGSPSIPDSNLGYELDWGFSWKLLEGYVLQSTFGIWQPGKWFSYACVDRSNPGWKNPGPGNNFGITPNRSIDPVFGMEILLMAEF
jgi:hypothetical protein